MLRITKIFASESVEIHKVEGKITDENLQLWSEQLKALHENVNREILLDFCHVLALSAGAVAILINHLSQRMRVMNPSMEIRNILHSAGLSARVLE